MPNREDEDFKSISQMTKLFDTSGSFKSDLLSGIEEAAKIYAEMHKDQKIFWTEEEKAAEAINELVADRYAEAKAAHDKEVANMKAIQKIELQIAKAKKEDRKQEEKALNKRLETVKAAQKIEKETQALLADYNDDIEARQQLAEAKKKKQEARNTLIKDGLATGNWGEVKQGLTGGESGVKGFVNAMDKMVSTVADLVKQLDKTIEEIASYKSDWDTRLFGSGSGHQSLTGAIQKALGASPFVKQSEVLKQIDKAVDLGISYNIEQRAFLEAIKDDIAGTFDAFDSTLLHIIRVQQQDSTASRMGMEVALNEYFNKMYKNTEYLTSLSDTVTGALYEATSLLTANQSVAFEYQVQKWLGSLYSVGMSNQGVSSIAQALGQLAAGDISGTSSGAGKLLVMAASRAGFSYSDILTKGINDSTINTLMEQMVEYLKTIANSNKVVQSQLAGIYGLNTSDIQAVSNLTAADMESIFGESFNYQKGLDKLDYMAKTIGKRMNHGEMMTNLIDNFKSTLATGVANNPALYALWTVSNMLDQLVGGIPIPAIEALTAGTGGSVDLETTVADLMRVGAMSMGLFSGIGSLVSGLGNNATGLSGVLKALNVGQGQAMRTKGNGFWGDVGITTTTSQISYIGNSAGTDIQDSIMQSAEDQKKELMIQNQSEEDDADKDIKLKDLNATATDILNLLKEVISNGAIKVSYNINGINPGI